MKPLNCSERGRVTTSLILLAVMAASGCSGLANRPKPVHDPKFAPVFPEPVPKSVNSIGSIYQPGAGVMLFEDSKAHRVGDLLTVELSERTNAFKTATTATGKKSTVALPAPTLFGGNVTLNGENILNSSVTGDTSFSGDGSSSQSNSLSGNITVSVVEVLHNGNLVIRGEKLVTLNQGDEFIRIAGIVRPADISVANTIASAKIANAEIIYGGDGVLDSANDMGWITKFFNSGWWPL
ncbi:MAG: flagellar basal body L-ring protein FlgH [Gammaproteobacteria bacterium]|nr:flagellar basal body L-ring protein FlgH [Gammaproteobacteria bacterium]